MGASKLDWIGRFTLGCGVISGSWPKGNRAHYACYNCPGCRGVNVREEELEATFVELLDRLRPR